MTNATRAMPVTATTVFFPIEEFSQSQPWQGPVRAEAEGEVIMYERKRILKKLGCWCNLESKNCGKNYERPNRRDVRFSRPAAVV